MDNSVQTDSIQRDDNWRQHNRQLQGEEEEEEEGKENVSHNQQNTILSSNEYSILPRFNWDMDNLSYTEDFFEMDTIVPLGELEWGNEAQYR